ncbi:hypothetical protein V6N13_078689 [Hibiscus sabdariffa]|uniref:Uncharacterized protein n=1 Tax=Hibiscus sabdariffa TaxID=183260 RepID=A0ABR2RPZ9_9ROSI
MTGELLQKLGREKTKICMQRQSIELFSDEDSGGNSLVVDNLVSIVEIVFIFGHVKACPLAFVRVCMVTTLAIAGLNQERGEDEC